LRRSAKCSMKIQPHQTIMQNHNDLCIAANTMQSQKKPCAEFGNEITQPPGKT
jgi:hypothetical protein